MNDFCSWKLEHFPRTNGDQASEQENSRETSPQWTQHTHSTYWIRVPSSVSDDVCVCVVKTFAAGAARGCACVKAHVSNEKQRIRNGKNCMPSGIWCIGYSFTVTGLFVDRWWAFVNNVIGYNFQIHWIFLGYHVFKRWPSNQHTKLLNVYYTYVYIIILCIYYVYIMYILYI